jgi:hypothetical protein
MLAFLLISILLFPATGRARPLIDDDQDDDQDTSVLPYDRYEAMKIAQTFKEELEKGNDIAPLIDKYFVKDFDERFALEAAETFWFLGKPKALTQANKVESRRYYIALTNFTFLFMRIYFTLEKREREKLIANGGQANEEIHDVETLFPKDVIDSFRGNPYLKSLIPYDANDEPQTPVESTDVPVMSAATETETDADNDEHAIKTPEQLSEVTAAMEFAATRMRKFLSTLPAENTALDYLMPIDDESDSVPSSFGVSDNIYITEEESFYGVPKGTRLVCAGVFNLHIDMIRIDGELKVLSVYMPVRD